MMMMRLLFILFLFVCHSSVFSQETAAPERGTTLDEFSELLVSSIGNRDSALFISLCNPDSILAMTRYYSKEDTSAQGALNQLGQDSQRLRGLFMNDYYTIQKKVAQVFGNRVLKFEYKDYDVFADVGYNCFTMAVNFYINNQFFTLKLTACKYNDSYYSGAGIAF